MSIKKYYIDKENIELIEILENYSEYTEECILVVKDILLSRNITKEELKEIALKVVKKKIQNIFIELNLTVEKIEPHSSPFFTEEEMLEIYITEYNIFRQKQFNNFKDTNNEDDFFDFTDNDFF